MKYILITIFIILIFLRAESKSQPALEIGEVSSENKLYQNLPNPFDDVTLIEFNIEEDNFVKLYISDMDGNRVETLVESEVNQGNYKIYFKTREDLRNINYKCSMEIYSEDKSTIIFSDEKIMNCGLQESVEIK